MRQQKRGHPRCRMLLYSGTTVSRGRRRSLHTRLFLDGVGEARHTRHVVSSERAGIRCRSVKHAFSVDG